MQSEMQKNLANCGVLGMIPRAMGRETRASRSTFVGNELGRGAWARGHKQRKERAGKSMHGVSTTAAIKQRVQPASSRGESRPRPAQGAGDPGMRSVSVVSDQDGGGAHVDSAPTIVIADDHPVIRLGVRMALLRGGFRVLAEAADHDGAVSAVVRERPDLCLLDVCMPGGGIEAARAIARDAPGTRVVMLTVSESSDDLLAALRAGAVGYLPKDTHPDRLPAALCGVLKGEAALPRALVGHVLHHFRGYTAAVAEPVRVGGVELTVRESEILRLLRSGLSTAEIGESLALSPITVRRHISAGVAKLGVADRDAAVRAIEPVAASA